MDGVVAVVIDIVKTPDDPFPCMVRRVSLVQLRDQPVVVAQPHPVIPRLRGVVYSHSERVRPDAVRSGTILCSTVRDAITEMCESHPTFPRMLTTHHGGQRTGSP